MNTFEFNITSFVRTGANTYDKEYVHFNHTSISNIELLIWEVLTILRDDL